MDEIKTLFPGEEITIEGEVITVKPFSFGQLPKVLGLRKKLATEIAEIQHSSKEMTQDAVIDLLAAGGEDIQQVIAYSAGISLATVQNLLPDDGIRLAHTVFKVNKSFFVQRMLPLVKELMAKPQDGQT